jgi:hypothetical protein
MLISAGKGVLQKRKNRLVLRPIGQSLGCDDIGEIGDWDLDTLH